MSTIIRSAREHPYAVIDKYGSHDPNLSWKAKGILTYLLTLPDDWQIFITELVTHARDGKDATATGVNELIENRYIIRRRQHQSNGQFGGYQYVVFERPQLADLDDTVSGFSGNGFPENGKPATTKERKLTKKKSKSISAGFIPPQSEAEIRDFKNKVYKVFLEKMNSRQIAGAPHWAKWETTKFYEHYADCNWKTGRNRMKSWQRAVANWFNTGLEKRRYRSLCPDDPGYSIQGFPTPPAAGFQNETPVYDNPILDRLKIKRL